jgi:hypothetical protein
MARFLRSGPLNRVLFSIEVIFHPIFPALFLSCFYFVYGLNLFRFTRGICKE